MEKYLPEGRTAAVSAEPEPRQALHSAIESRRILEASVTLCDEHHNLILDLGAGLIGIIPREEAALGIREGTVRDGALVSKVGKQVCFHVAAACGQKHFRLSRRSAQEEALQHFLSAIECGDILPATVTAVADFGVFCDIGCGLAALLGREAVSVSGAANLSERFSRGDRIFAAVDRIDRKTGRIWLTHWELLGTWEENASLFHSGQTVTGKVRSVQDYGIFVELMPNLTGLAEPQEGCRLGDTVSVYIKSIQPEKGKVKLAIVENLGNTPLRRPIRYFKIDGNVGRWQYHEERFPQYQRDFLISSQ